MKLRSFKSLCGMVSVLMLIMVGLALLTQGWAVKAQNKAGEGQARKLEGTWRAQVTIRVCQTGFEIRTFPALVSFNQGGTFTGAAAGISPARASADYGVWRNAGGQTYEASSEAFLFSPTGDWIGTQRVKRIIEIGDDPDLLSATTSIEIVDTNNNVTGTGCATTVAQRLE
jgi:hypothetical protein